MPTLPSLTPPASASGAAPGLPTTPQQSTVPTVYMDPTTQQSILGQLQRSGWNATQPTPDIQYVSNGIGGVTPVVKGYKMVLSDPRSGATQTVNLTYDPTAAGKGAQWGIAGDVGDLPKTTQAQAIGNADVGYYLPDASGQYQLVVPPKTPNADDEIKKAVDRQDAEAQRNERAVNQAAGRGYMTNAEYAKIANDAASQNLNQAELAEKIRQFDATQGQSQRQFDVQQAAKDKVDAANILKTGAETAQTQAQTVYTGAQTQSVQQATQLAAQKAPAEIEQLKAQTAAQLASAGVSNATIQKTLQEIEQGRAPTTVQNTLATTSPNYAQVDPNTGQVTFQANPNYQPKTQAEIAARAGQIHNLALQKQQEVQGKVGQNGYTADDALKEFNGWWDSNVAPEAGSLQAAQEEAQFQRAKDQAGMRQGAYQTALGAGTQAISGFNAMAGANPVGPGYADVMNQVREGKIPTGEQMASAFTYQAPNPTDLARQGTMEALKYIDPTAAAATGTPPPNYGNINPLAFLNRSSYQFNAPPGAGPPPPTPPSAPAGLPDWQRADQMFGGAPAGNAMAAPGVAGTVAPGSPQFLGTFANPWDASTYSPFA